ncbi:MAG: hypothetical protein ISR65_20070 [Bacteriovoracaceae bacterium]|nr:hypothetical protein [Bacteriovoracaceae bacterium]
MENQRSLNLANLVISQISQLQHEPIYAGMTTCHRFKIQNIGYKAASEISLFGIAPPFHLMRPLPKKLLPMKSAEVKICYKPKVYPNKNPYPDVGIIWLPQKEHINLSIKYNDSKTEQMISVGRLNGLVGKSLSLSQLPDIISQNGLTVYKYKLHFKGGIHPKNIRLKIIGDTKYFVQNNYDEQGSCVLEGNNEISEDCILLIGVTNTSETSSLVQAELIISYTVASDNQTIRKKLKKAAKPAKLIKFEIIAHSTMWHKGDGSGFFTKYSACWDKLMDTTSYPLVRFEYAKNKWKEYGENDYVDGFDHNWFTASPFDELNDDYRGGRCFYGALKLLEVPDQVIFSMRVQIKTKGTDWQTVKYNRAPYMAYRTQEENYDSNKTLFWDFTSNLKAQVTEYKAIVGKEKKLFPLSQFDMSLRAGDYETPFMMFRRDHNPHTDKWGKKNWIKFEGDNIFHLRNDELTFKHVLGPISSMYYDKEVKVFYGLEIPKRTTPSTPMNWVLNIYKLGIWKSDVDVKICGLDEAQECGKKSDGLNLYFVANDLISLTQIMQSDDIEKIRSNSVVKLDQKTLPVGKYEVRWLKINARLGAGRKRGPWKFTHEVLMKKEFFVKNGVRAIVQLKESLKCKMNTDNRLQSKLPLGSEQINKPANRRVPRDNFAAVIWFPNDHRYLNQRGDKMAQVALCKTDRFPTLSIMNIPIHNCFRLDRMNKFNIVEQNYLPLPDGKKLWQMALPKPEANRNTNIWNINELVLMIANELEIFKKGIYQAVGKIKDKPNPELVIYIGAHGIGEHRNNQFFGHIQVERSRASLESWSISPAYQRLLTIERQASTQPVPDEDLLVSRLYHGQIIRHIFDTLLKYDTEHSEQKVKKIKINLIMDSCGSGTFKNTAERIIPGEYPGFKVNLITAAKGDNVGSTTPYRPNMNIDGMPEVMALFDRDGRIPADNFREFSSLLEHLYTEVLPVHTHTKVGSETIFDKKYFKYLAGNLLGAPGNRVNHVVREVWSSYQEVDLDYNSSDVDMLFRTLDEKMTSLGLKVIAYLNEVNHVVIGRKFCTKGLSYIRQYLPQFMRKLKETDTFNYSSEYARKKSYVVRFFDNYEGVISPLADCLIEYQDGGSAARCNAVKELILWFAIYAQYPSYYAFNLQRKVINELNNACTLLKEEE